jgi:SAM-dependent methyltransferase
MDVKSQVLAVLDGYAQRHADEVTEEMKQLWLGWIDEALAVASRMEPVDGFHVNDNPRVVSERWRLAERYLSGDGIEIGGLHSPQPVPAGARVRYVDRLPANELAWHYVDVGHFQCVEVDVVDDGERLESFDDDSLDFLISSHFLEHCQDPIRALLNQLRVLRPGGMLYCAVPDSRHSFDVERPRTSFEHLWTDHTLGPQGSRVSHYQEWARHVEHLSGAQFEAKWRLLCAVDYSIHFHVWTPKELLELLVELPQRVDVAFELTEYLLLPGECVFILRKS